jgi:hypothetical protein
MKKVRDDHLMSQAVREALDSVVSPSVRDALLEDALTASNEPELPSDPDHFREFVGGPLRDVLVKALGAELGDSVALELGRLADLASIRPAAPQGERRTRSGQMRSPSSPPKRRGTPPPRAAWPPSVAPAKKVTLKSPAHARHLPPAKSSPPTLRPPPHDAKTPQAAPPPVPRSARDSKLLPYSPTIPAGRKPLSSQIPRTPSSAEFPKGTAARLGMAGTSPDSESSQGLDSSGRRVALVLVASRDMSLTRKISQWIDPRAVVMRSRSLLALLHDLEDAGEARVVVVIDCSAPSIRPLALAAVAEELPPRVQVVLWGASADTERDILAFTPSASNWIVCGAETTAKDLAARCVELVG